MIEDLSNMNVMGYSSRGFGRYPRINNGKIERVKLSDILKKGSPMTSYLKVEYQDFKKRYGEASFEDYKKMAFADTSFDYYSRKDQDRDLVMSIIVNGAVILVGAQLPVVVMAAIGLVSGTKNIYEAASGKDVLTGKKLSTSDRIFRGMFGVADIALAGYSGVKIAKGKKLAKLDAGKVGKGRGAKKIEKTPELEDHIRNTDPNVP